MDFELGILDFEFLQLSAFSSRCAGRGEREDEVWAGRISRRLIQQCPQRCQLV
jgi:hypothetical protein